MTTLISFLGKSKADPRTGYRTARYRISPEVCSAVPFMGMALAKHLQPDRLVLLGTPGSMWDVFFEREAESRVLDQADQWQALSEAVTRDAVTADMLEGYSRHLSQQLGMEVECRLISTASNEAQQVQLLQDLSDAVRKGETLDLDVTHSFRHLPMLALVAARYLSRVKRVQVRDIYYGALEMTDATTGETPVVRLDGLLRMLDWVEALAGYDRDGDYSVFATLLAEEELAPSRVQLLRGAAFHERMHNTERARDCLQSVVPALEAHQGAMSRLFLPQLLKRLSWFRAPERHERERLLAEASLDRRDYLRAAILLQEAVLSRGTAHQASASDDFYARDQYRNDAKNDPNVRDLVYLRNGMAHTVTSNNRDINETLQDEGRLGARLRQLKTALFGPR